MRYQAVDSHFSRFLGLIFTKTRHHRCLKTYYTRTETVLR
jgi:hypothetical protein